MDARGIRARSLTVTFLLTVGLLSVATWLAQASTHWVVTEEGRIQSQLNSIYHMKRPDDLIALMEQEKRMAFLESLKYEMSEQTLDAVEARGQEASLETKLFFEDDDCLEAQQSLAEFDLFISTLVLPDNEAVSEAGGPFFSAKPRLPPNQAFREPNCSRNQEKRTLKNVDCFVSILENSELKMMEEVGLMQSILEELSEDQISLSEYGHLVDEALEGDPNNWVAHLYASTFWRISGHASRAIECLRHAYALADPRHKYMPVLGLANVLHRSQKSEDAAGLLSTAAFKSLDESSSASSDTSVHKKNSAAVHFTLGNVHATLLNFNESADSYTQALRHDPSFHPAKLRRHAVLCHQKIERALERQQIELQKTLRELRIYKKQHEQWTEVLNKIMEEQASLEERLRSRFEYESLKILGSHDGRGQDCKRVKKKDKVFIACTTEALGGVTTSGGDSLSPSAGGGNLNDLVRRLEGRVEGGVDEDQDPTLRPRYSSYPPQPPRDQELEPDCDKLSKWNTKDRDQPAVFVSPADKGFDFEKFFAGAGLDRDAPSLHPWESPTCPPFDGEEVELKTLKTLMAGTKSRLQLSSESEQFWEEKIYGLSPVKNLEEFGARLAAAIKQDVKPSWILFVMAGGYWRLRGRLEKSQNCFFNAMAVVPERFKDVVLTNLAQLIYSSGGKVDNAILLVKSALKVAEKDPDVNFLLGNLLMAKEQPWEALEAYQRTAKMLPNYHPKLQVFLAQAKCMQSQLHCHVNSRRGCNGGGGGHSPPEVNAVLSKLVTCSAGAVDGGGGDCGIDLSADEGDVGEVIARIEIASGSTASSAMKKLKTANSKDSKDPSSGSSPTDVPTASETGKKPGDKVNEEIRKSGETVFAAAVDSYPVLVDVDDPQLRDPEVFIVASLVKTQGGFNPDKQPPVEDPLPELYKKLHRPPRSSALKCTGFNDANLVEYIVSAVLEVGSKGKALRLLKDESGSGMDGEATKEPKCFRVPASMELPDHLKGIANRHRFSMVPELGLMKTLQATVGDFDFSMEHEYLGSRLADALEEHPQSWLVSAVASLFWRVEGNYPEAVECLRHSVHFAPAQAKDVGLLGLANLLHNARMPNDALIVAQQAYQMSGHKYAILPFAIAQIYVSLGNYDKANVMYEESLKLQPDFTEAKRRHQSLDCL